MGSLIMIKCNLTTPIMNKAIATMPTTAGSKEMVAVQDPNLVGGLCLYGVSNQTIKQ